MGKGQGGHAEGEQRLGQHVHLLGVELAALYEFNDPLPPGPATVAAQFDSDPIISQTITPLDLRGSRVVFGDLQIVPVGKGLVYVRPLYVRPDDTAARQVFVRKILASYDEKSVIADSVTAAIGKLFNGFNTNLGDRVDDGKAGSATDTSGSTSSGSTSGTSGSTTPTTAPATIRARGTSPCRRAAASDITTAAAAPSLIGALVAAVTGTFSDVSLRATLHDVRTLTQRANAIAGDAQAIATHVRQGHGTIGALVMDEEIYDDLQEMVRDLKHNPWKFFWRE